MTKKDYSQYADPGVPSIPQKKKRSGPLVSATVAAPTAQKPVLEAPVPETPATSRQPWSLGSLSTLSQKVREALAPLGKALSKNTPANPPAKPLVPAPNVAGQNAAEQRKADRLALILEQQQAKSDDFHKELEKFYRTGSLQGAMSRDDWLKSSSGRFEDTLAARLTSAIRSSSAVEARRIELSRAMQAGLGDPTLARGSHQREVARMQGVRQAEREARDAEKARADAYYSWWRSQNQVRRDAKKDVDDAGQKVKAAYLGGFTGGFRVMDNGWHERSAVASMDKLGLVAKSFGL